MFHHRSDGELWVRCYLIDPQTIDTIERAVYWGNSAAEHIKQCEAMISRLRDYQKMIYDRVQELSTAPYYPRVRLVRERRYRESKVYFHLIVENVYTVPGIRPVVIQQTNYPGSQRREAIKAFEDYIKSHPGIESELDIAPAQWERR